MAQIKYKNPCDYTFLIWADNYPESYHPLDMQRFYVFVKNVIRYRPMKWNDFDYFRTRLSKVNTRLTEEDIETYYNKMLELIAFSKTAINLYTNPYLHDDRSGYYQRGVINDELYETKITREEFYS